VPLDSKHLVGEAEYLQSKGVKTVFGSLSMNFERAEAQFDQKFLYFSAPHPTWLVKQSLDARIRFVPRT
jgi:hypothetical protein